MEVSDCHVHKDNILQTHRLTSINMIECNKRSGLNVLIDEDLLCIIRTSIVKCELKRKTMDF